MDSENVKLREEVLKLRAEVRRLKRFRGGLLLAVLLVLAMLAPELVGVVVVAGAVALVGLMFSPARHIVFPSLFKNRSWPGYDF